MQAQWNSNSCYPPAYSQDYGKCSGRDEKCTQTDCRRESQKGSGLGLKSTLIVGATVVAAAAAAFSLYRFGPDIWRSCRKGRPANNHPETHQCMGCHRRCVTYCKLFRVRLSQGGSRTYAVCNDCCNCS
ncbi:hypothetical protein Ddc_14109 [Ditylenchus destructor]|nr:hypothetical protein Ddc_14109 [Ditylenchus destructor]